VQEVARLSRGGDVRSLSGLLARRYALLNEVDLDVVDMATVIGSEVDADLLTASLGRPLTETLEALERAEAAGVVAAAPGHPGRFVFVHALFRTSRYESMPLSRRLQLHHAVANALEARRDDDRVVPALARHACIAAPIGDAHAALQYALRAAALAERSLALDEATDHYRRALDVAEHLDPPDAEARLDVSIRLGEVLNRTGDPAHRELLLEAAAEARRVGNAHALAEIAWAFAQYGASQRIGGSDVELVAIAEDALAGLGPEPTATRARTLAALASDLGVSVDMPRAFDLVSEALAIARGLDDPITLGHVLLTYRVAGNRVENPAARHPTADELIAIGRRTNQRIFTVLGLVTRAWAFRLEGNLAACDEAVETYAAMIEDRPIPPNTRSQLILFRAMRHLLAGDAETAERMAESVLELPAAGGFDPMSYYGAALMAIRYQQGRISELTPFIELGPRFGIYGAVLTVAYAVGYRIEEARTLLHELSDGGSFRRYAGQSSWPSLVLLSETAALVEDVELADRLESLLAPQSGLLADVQLVTVGPVDLALAQAAFTAGHVEASEAYAARAVEASRRRRTPFFLGRELVQLAASRRQLGAQPSAIEPLVLEAVAIAERHGSQAVNSDALRLGLLDLV
jgi:hypothetical protein